MTRQREAITPLENSSVTVSQPKILASLVLSLINQKEKKFCHIKSNSVRDGVTAFQFILFLNNGCGHIWATNYS